MGYEIPYSTDYENWYGTPTNVARLSVSLEQVDEKGRITASWDMPDNGGTFNVLVSTDETNYTMELSNIKNNSVVFYVEPNTSYYVKVVTVLGTKQSSGTVAQASVVTIPTPSAPTLIAVSGGIQIEVAIIPSYSVKLSISDGTSTNTVYTSSQVFMYMCDGGSYSVTAAYVNANGNVGSDSTASAVTVPEVATQTYTDTAIANYANGTEIVSNSDLDNITTAGNYYCKNSTIAATLTNCPVSDAFAMIVLNYDTSVIQLIFADSGKMYQRFALGSWYVHDGVLVTQGGV